MISNAHNAGWKRVLAGMAGGAAGTAAMGIFMKAASRAAGAQNRQPQPKMHDVSLFGRKHEEGESATAALGRLAFQAATHREPDPKTKHTLSEAVHWLYGVGQGAAYGLLLGKDARSAVPDGLAFGAALWLFGDEIAIPLLGLSEGPKAYPAALHAQTLGAHLVYGVVAAATVQLIERASRPAILARC
jgi:hypothetical protein